MERIFKQLIFGKKTYSRLQLVLGERQLIYKFLELLPPRSTKSMVKIKAT